MTCHAAHVVRACGAELRASSEVPKRAVLDEGLTCFKVVLIVGKGPMGSGVDPAVEFVIRLDSECLCQRLILEESSKWSMRLRVVK